MFKKILKKILVQEKGQGLVEYALILVLVAIVVIAILLTLGPTVGQVYCKVANGLQAGSCTIGVTITSGPAVASLGGGVYRVTVGVKVPEPTEVTLTAGGKTVTETCSSSCSLQVTNVPASGTYLITTAAGGSAGGAYPASTP